MDKQLADLDLNLIKLLKVVVETKNTHQAAKVLGISQPSVSRGLAKLKETFGEQLVIRKAHGIEPSELAEKLAEAADDMLLPISKVIQAYQNFNPLEFDGEVSLAITPSLLEVFGSDIYLALETALPKAKIKLRFINANSLNHLLNARVDYIIQLGELSLPQEIYTHTLKRIKLAIVAREDHPVLSQSSELADIHHLPIVRMAPENQDSKNSTLQNFYSAKGYQANIVLDSHEVEIMTGKLKRSDAITYSSSFITHKNPELKCYPLPSNIPREYREIPVFGNYLQTRRGSPLSQLIHQLLSTCLNDFEQPEN
ncbi:LysR family transcriptional regulator [Agarivorans sp. Alg241-V36]|uniref:LysR family transcriptional regulator n=1 Tax=Agarivorans sp. Alg241-V36 TaxID=2305992 RepID=UPI0013D7BE1F|nr:LysR family transcriptional regulator [Agarivorans sp. Alg241-V36]